MATTAEIIAEQHKDLRIVPAPADTEPQVTPLTSSGIPPSFEDAFARRRLPRDSRGRFISRQFDDGANLVATTVAHELRNPLASAYGFAQIAMREGSIDPEIGGIILKALARTSAAIDRIVATTQTGTYKTKESESLSAILDIGATPKENRTGNPNSRFYRPTQPFRG